MFNEELIDDVDEEQVKNLQSRYEELLKKEKLLDDTNYQLYLMVWKYIDKTNLYAGYVLTDVIREEFERRTNAAH